MNNEDMGRFLKKVAEHIQSMGFDVVGIIAVNGEVTYGASSPDQNFRDFRVWVQKVLDLPSLEVKVRRTDD